VQLLTGEPALGEGEASVEPLTVALTIPVEVEQRLKALESEVQELRRELTELRRALGE
ncbi:MAG: hypothetical protein RLZZ142_1086, partial [Verrucomicrobiota bacterium]